MDAKKLESMKYNELQKLAKQNGIKANMKLNKLREALMDHFKSAAVNQKEQQSAVHALEPKSTTSKATKSPKTVKTPSTTKTPTAVKGLSTPKSINSPKPISKTPAKPVSKDTAAVNSFVNEHTRIPDEPTPEPQTKRRRSTFEKVPTPELHTDKAPEVEHTRRSTFVVKTPQSGKKPENNKKTESKTPKENENKTQIPRFAAFLAKRKQETESSESKVLTPGKNKDWKKIHEKNFEKMESIDEYLAKKRKRNDDYTESVKKTKKILSDTLAMVDKLKSYKTPTGTGDQKKTFITKTPNTAPFKPTVLSTKDMKLNFSENRKSPRTSSAAKPFKPTVFSTKNMDLNFTSPAPTRKSAGSAVSKSKTTPFKFNASLNNTLNGSMSAKKSFDLQASLARPITWKAHKGKLKPFNSQTAFSNGSHSSVKTPSTQTRDDRRKLMAAKRSSAKFNSTLERRGLKV